MRIKYKGKTLIKNIQWFKVCPSKMFGDLTKIEFISYGETEDDVESFWLDMKKGFDVERD